MVLTCSGRIAPTYEVPRNVPNLDRRQWSVGVGALHHYSEKLRIGLSFQWTSLGNASVNTANVKGDYKSNEMLLFGATMAWKKLPWSGWGTL